MDIYASLIFQAKKILPPNIEIQCRFSGGEPLALNDKLFRFSERIYNVTRIKPYILTNGTKIDQDFIDSARKNHINFLAVSLENPLNPSTGAPHPKEIINKITRYNSSNFPIIPGVTIVRNEDFKNLYSMCRIFYKKLKVLPTINELSFQAFIPPTKKQLKDLYENIFKIVSFFYLKTPIRLFPYISPELCYGGLKHYIIELDLENKHHLTKNNLDKGLFKVLNQLNISYPKLNCEDYNCEWHNECERIKWVWHASFEKANAEKRLKSYCEMKKTINNSFFEALKSFK